MTRLYVVHVASDYAQAITQRYVNAENARHAVTLSINDPALVIAVVVQGTGERVSKDLWS